MSVAAEYEWDLLREFSGGRRLFRDHLSGRYAVADQSGATPDATDDGVMWLDPGQRIQHHPWTEHARESLSLRLQGEDGEPKTIGLSIEEAFYYSSTFAINIHMPNGIHTCHRF